MVEGVVRVSGAARDPGEQLPLTSATLNILLALSGEERHGYGIMSEVSLRTGGSVRLGPGTLYTSLKRMLAAGIVEESDERPDPELDDKRRRYYRLSGFGERVLAAEIDRLEQTVREARSRGVVPDPATLPEGA